jgi:hypothetical protein
MLLHSFSLNTGNDIGTEAGANFAEALKSNTSLTFLNLSGNRLVVVISFSLIQEIKLFMHLNRSK